MIKIPQNSKFTQTNTSDLTGNIWYTKNINFDEEGYLKLSSRAVSLLNDKNDASFGNPLSFGRTGFGAFYVRPDGTPYTLSLSNSLLTLTKDGGTTPSGSVNSFGIWYNKLWNVTTDNKMYYKTVSTGLWTDTTITLTSGVAHPLCSFEKANTILVGNGNTVIQLSTAYATGSLAQLSISADYEVIGISYNNNIAGISTRLANTVTGENKEAGFFVWDGSASSANNMYYVGSDTIVAVFPYKNSFIIITREGQLKYFNGGGFDNLASLPVAFKDIIWGDFNNKLSYGDTIKVDGENIYINLSSYTIDNKINYYTENMIGGIWCYNPKVGLYHRYSPSISQASVLDVQTVDVATGLCTVYNTFSYPLTPTIPETGNPIKFMNGELTGLHNGIIYYIIKSSPTAFKLALTKQDAIDGNSIAITSTGGNNYFMVISVKDYGQNKNSNTGVGGIGITGYKSYQYDHLLFGGIYPDSNSSAFYSHLNITSAGFKNIGYFTTPKIYSQGVEDIFQKLFTKYRPLQNEDKIIIKYKDKESNNIPEIASCTVTSSTVITTTTYIPNSYAYIDELECEIIGGSGAGQMAKINSITESLGTYTITLSEALDGLVASDLCDIKIDNWKVLGEITPTDTLNWKELPLSTNSKWIKFKIELQGCDTTIEELQIINKEHIKSV